MAKFIKLILTLVLTVALWGGVSNVFTVQAVNQSLNANLIADDVQGVFANPMTVKAQEASAKPMTVDGQELSNGPVTIETRIANASRSSLAAEGRATRSLDRQGCYISAPQLPYISDAEISSSGGTVQLLSFPRAQRSYITEYILTLKSVVEQMAHREGALALHREKLFDIAAFCRCSPVSEYYVFALRHIII